MNTISRHIEDVLTKEYDLKRYIEMISEVFKLQFVSPNEFHQETSNFSSHIEGYIHIGNFITSDSKKIIILSIQLKNDSHVRNARSTQRNYAKKLVENANCDAALVAFYTPNDPKWRLSFVRLDYEMKIENGKMKLAENLTPAKRYSFLVGKDEPCHTVIERFQSFITDNNVFPSLDDIEEAFSVEKVTNEFFSLYCEKYHQLREHLESNENFVIESKQHNFSAEQFAKKLMGQIVFLYFLQKKGWMGVEAWKHQLSEVEYKNAYYSRGEKSRELIPTIYKLNMDGQYIISSDALKTLNSEDKTILSSCVDGYPWGTGSHKFMRELFNRSKSCFANFHHEFLEPLLYNTLNNNRSSQGYCPSLQCRIPFLSGGLFEPIDGYEWEHNNFNIPNEIFSNKKHDKDRDANGILDIFDRYNFTVAEDEPMEREVAIDPEMLGKVFENLLEVKDRKSKGAYYTPRDIVHFMCRESLINYLVNVTGVDEISIREFILYGDFMKDEDTDKLKRQANGGMYISDQIFKLNEESKITVNRLRDIDDALASVRIADPAVGSGAFSLGMLNEIVRARYNLTAYMTINMSTTNIRLLYQNERSFYALKYATIKNCIFAADIEPSAVDIAQLRLWLSLVIDDEINPDAANPLEGHKHPIPLPNLESNILCGNSLIDEFEGIQLINPSDIINTGENDNYFLIQNNFDPILRRLIETQDELFHCEDAAKKTQLKASISALKDMIFTAPFEDASPDKTERFNHTKTMSSKPYILWQLDFARIFREKGGFDIVIGNPPWGLLNKKQNQSTSIKASADEIQYYSTNPIYQPAKGHMLNIFRLFICKSYELLRQNGHLSLIFPMAFMCDISSYNLREFIINNTAIEYLEAFPERDDENKRVFKSAKMSVCILGCNKRKENSKRKFPIRINKDKYINPSVEKVFISSENIQIIDQNCLTIPIVNAKELDILIKICSNSKRMANYSKCYTGEIDITQDKKYIKYESSYHEMLRGAQVQRYYITNNVSQGDILFLDSSKYLSENHSSRSLHFKKKRIVMQGITGINEKYRLKMTIINENVFCANSVNYLLPEKDYLYLLGLCNSYLLNWFFKKLSTNSNVNGYEIDNLPVIETNDLIKGQVINLVSQMVDKQDHFCPELDDELNSLIYKIYGLTNEDISVIENAIFE